MTSLDRVHATFNASHNHAVRLRDKLDLLSADLKGHPIDPEVGELMRDAHNLHSRIDRLHHEFTLELEAAEYDLQHNQPNMGYTPGEDRKPGTAFQEMWG